MHFSIRHRRKNQVSRIDGPETVARHCGDFWTVIYPGPARAVEANPCKFRLLAGNRGLRAVATPNAGSAAIQPCELIVTDDSAGRCFMPFISWPASALERRASSAASS